MRKEARGLLLVLLAGVPDSVEQISHALGALSKFLTAESKGHNKVDVVL